MDTGILDGIRQKSDLTLYSDGQGAGGTAYQVECATCHDPHGPETVPGTPNPTFLRIANTGSAVCLTCHAK